MAAKKKKKAAKKAPSKKAKKAKKAKKTKKTARKAAKKSKKKTVKAARKAAPRKAAKKAAPKKPTRKAKKKQTVGEGDYQASRTFLKDQSGFVKKNKAKIPAMGKEAEAALEGPQGDMLREAEASAAGRSRDLF
jgi:flagellar motor protein MotB